MSEHDGDAPESPRTMRYSARSSVSNPFTARNNPGRSSGYDTIRHHTPPDQTLRSVAPPPAPQRQNEEARRPAPVQSDRTLRAGSETRTRSRNVPAELERRFKDCRELRIKGGEADVFEVWDQDDNRRLLKLYRQGVKPNHVILEKLQRSDISQIVPLFDFGETEGVWYEIQEYVPGGTLSEYIKANVIDDAHVERAFRTLALGISQLHELGIIHRDIKPDNIFIRSVSPLDLVIGDFSISSHTEHGEAWTELRGTAKYTAPELMGLPGVEVRVSPAADYWALGVILLELLQANPLAKASPAVAGYNVGQQGIDVSQAPAHWQLLCRGLLTKSDQHRWGARQIARWLAGERDIPVHREQATSGARVYVLGDRQFASLPDLLLFFCETLENWEIGVREIANRELPDGVRDRFNDQNAARYISELRDEDAPPEWLKRSGDAPLDENERLFVVLAHFCRELPPVWMAQPLDRDNLLKLCDGNNQYRKEEDDLLAKIYNSSLLSVHAQASKNPEYAKIEREWRGYIEELQNVYRQARSHGAQFSCPDDHKLLRITLPLVLDRDNYVRKLRSSYNAAMSKGAKMCSWYKRLGGSDVGLVLAQLKAKVGIDQGLWKERRIQLLRNTLINGLHLGLVMLIFRFVFSRTFGSFDDWRPPNAISGEAAGEGFGYILMLAALIGGVAIFWGLQRLISRNAASFK